MKILYKILLTTLALLTLSACADNKKIPNRRIAMQSGRLAQENER